MATADLITSFLNNEMSPEQERGFLLTVASSDTLRLELKSHVMLDRIFVAQSERAEVPEAIRGMIFAQAGVSISGSIPQTAPRPTGAVEAGRRLSRAFMSRFVRGGMFLLVASTGFAAGYFSGSESDPTPARNPSAVAPAQPAPSVDIVRPSAEAESVSSTEMNTSPVVESPSVSRETGRSEGVERRAAVRTNLESPLRTNPSASERRSAATGSVSQPAAGAPSAGTTSAPTVDPAPATITPPAASVNIQVNKPSADKKNPVAPEKKEEGSRMP